MEFQQNRIVGILMGMLLLFSACSEDENINPNVISTYGLSLQLEDYVPNAGIKVQVYTTKSLEVGYNPLYIALLDSVSGDVIQNGDIKLMPMMKMATMSHSSPYINPEKINTENNLYEGSVVFVMPGGDMGSWTLELDIAEGSKSGMVKFDIDVTAPENPVMHSFLAENDETKLFVSLAMPNKPTVGINDFSIMINKKDGMKFPAVTDYEIEIEPEMPTMNHGSPNNVNPVHEGNGMYTGKVNFTMTGLWRIHLKIKQQDAMVKEDIYFDVNFQ
ncbi:FixH family protein [Flexithrix dorotheae]|uniref:FixH family protein n=1 Tax=Flexithrix dorotheae TaxID=70993 RepID=UPI000367B381|nr:FixH family protein [Flexithrix dorotheae]